MTSAAEQSLALTVGGAIYREWKEVTVTRGIEQLSGSFELVCADRWAIHGQPLPSLRGQRCGVSLAASQVIAGYIDGVEPSYSPTDHSLTIRGRDATCDLVDCAALVDGQGWRDTSLLRMAQDLCKPFGIRVSADVPKDTPFRSGRISPGETIGEVLARAAAVAGCLLVADGVGGLRITKAGSGRASTRLRRGVNIIGGGGLEDDSQRFAEYRVIGQGSESESEASEISQQILASSHDKGVRKGRITVIQVSDDLDGDKARQVANWAAASALARSKRAEVMVRGWLDGDRPWMPNSLVTITDDWLRLDGEYLIAQVSNRLNDRDGKSTVLSVTPREAYVPAPVIDLDEVEA